MKVLLVNKFHYRKGGAETYYFGIADGLKMRGCEVAFFSMEDPRNEPCAQSQYFVPTTDYNRKTSLLKKGKEAISIAYNKGALRRFDTLCREFKPDVVHLNLVHRQITLSILDASYLKQHKIPVVWTCHDYIAICPNYLMFDGNDKVCDDCLSGDYGACVQKRCVKGSKAKSMLAAYEARFIRKHGFYQKIDRVIAPSEFMRTKLLEGGFPESQVITMHNFVGTHVLDQARQLLTTVDSEKPILLFFGRLSHEKGVDVLVDAFLSIEDQIPDWRLIIVGDGPERESLEAQVAGRSEGARIEFVGYQTGDALRSYIERASIAIMSSRWRENMPYSVIEAFASGTPVVGTRIGGIPELVSEGETGFLANPGDVVSLTEAILRGISLCGDKDAYRTMQSRCRAYVLENCDQTEYMERLVSLYRDLIETKGAC